MLAVDFGGTKVEAALVQDGVVLPGTRARRPTGAAASSDDLVAAVTGAVTEALGDRRVAAVGIGSAGPLDVARGLASPLNIPAWRDYPFVALVESLVPGARVELAIDGLAITLGEVRYGAAQGASNVMGMIVSTGVGGGLVLDGRGIHGTTGNAGHIGHVSIAGAVDPCACGRLGCLEAVASGPNSVRWAQSQGWEGSTGEDLAASDDPRARAAIERSARAVGQAIATTSALADLDVVAIGGGFSHSAPDYIDLVREGAADGFPFVRKTRIVAAGLGADAPLIGAAAIVA